MTCSTTSRSSSTTPRAGEQSRGQLHDVEDLLNNARAGETTSRSCSTPGARANDVEDQLHDVEELLDESRAPAKRLRGGRSLAGTSRALTPPAAPPSARVPRSCPGRGAR